MSRVTVDPLTYQIVFDQLVVSLINDGYTVAGAYAIAREEIADSFLCDPHQQIIEDQKDADDDKHGLAS